MASKLGPQAAASRQVLCGIFLVLRTRIQWDYLPEELAFGSGMTCRRRLRDGSEALAAAGPRVLHAIRSARAEVRSRVRELAGQTVRTPRELPPSGGRHVDRPALRPGLSGGRGHRRHEGRRVPACAP
ncbi:transposase [Streptomyces sp. NBC_01310]|uniref:transposase n=1 Tax=Streptomyces sp. NBC_01310 TaxID=2903820 RepID=UPI0035B6257A